MESNQDSSPKELEESGRSIARNRPKRCATKRSSLFGYNECDVCKKIENLEYLIQYENSLGNNHKSSSIRNNEEKLKQLRNHVCNNYYISLEDYADEDFCFDYYPVNRVPVGRGTRRTRHHKDEDEYLESEIMSKPRPRKMSKYEANSSTSGIEETKNRKDICKISSDCANKCDDYDEYSDEEEYNINSMKKVFKCVRVNSNHHKNHAEYGLHKEENSENKSRTDVKHKEISDDESIFEDADEDSSQQIVKSAKENVYEVDNFIIIEKYHEINLNGFIENSSDFSDDETEKNEYRLIKPPKADIPRSHHEIRVREEHIPINRNFERPENRRREEKFKRKEMSQEFDENKMSDASVSEERTIKHISRNVPIPQIKTSGSVPETKQHLPSIQNVIEKKSEIIENQNRLPPLGNWLSTENRVPQQSGNMNSMRMNEMTSYNIAAESPSNLHNCLFNKDVRYRQNNVYYSTNMCPPMNNYNQPVYLAIRPMSYSSIVPNSNMGNIIYSGDNKLILKAASSQQLIQIPISQLYQGQQQLQQTPYYQIPRNRYYGPH